MTIKELEARTGMTRANIRFYEQEGLLAPARLSNGYRDYSDADRDALEKIKLLRALHLDLNTIRALQAGEAELPASLEERLRELEADRAALDRAARVCRELRDAGTGYAALDPKPWLEELARDPAPASPRFAPPEDRAGPSERYLHPWRRFFARNVDLALYGLPWTAVCALVFHLYQSSNFLTRLLESYIAFGLMLVIEPLLLHFWGTTPGKAIFGITVRDNAGKKLSLSQARQRTFALFGRGLGWGIPFYDLYRQWKSYKAWEDIWGEGWEYDGAGEPEQYRFADDASWRCVLCAGVFVLIPALSVLLMLQGRLPPNRGPLTEAEFYENCNFYMDRLDVNTGRRLDSEGNWVDDSSHSSVVVSIFGDSQTRTVCYSVTLDESGAVTGAVVEETVTGDSFLWVGSDELIAALALAGSRSNCLNFHPDKWAELVPGDWWEYDVTRDGLRVTRTAELENLASDGFGELVPVQEGKTGRVTQRFEIRVVG